MRSQMVRYNSYQYPTEPHGDVTSTAATVGMWLGIVASSLVILGFVSSMFKEDD
jgi:hypothetical protein